MGKKRKVRNNDMQALFFIKIFKNSGDKNLDNWVKIYFAQKNFLGDNRQRLILESGNVTVFLAVILTIIECD